MSKPTLSRLKMDKPVKETTVDEMRDKKPKSGTRKMSLYVSSRTWRELQLRKIDEERDVNLIVNDAIAAYLQSSSGI